MGIELWRILIVHSWAEDEPEKDSENEETEKKNQESSVQDIKERGDEGDVTWCWDEAEDEDWRSAHLTGERWRGPSGIC